VKIKLRYSYADTSELVACATGSREITGSRSPLASDHPTGRGLGLRVRIIRSQSPKVRGGIPPRGIAETFTRCRRPDRSADEENEAEALIFIVLYLSVTGGSTPNPGRIAGIARINNLVASR